MLLVIVLACSLVANASISTVGECIDQLNVEELDDVRMRGQRHGGINASVLPLHSRVKTGDASDECYRFDISKEKCLSMKPNCYLDPWVGPSCRRNLCNDTCAFKVARSPSLRAMNTGLFRFVATQAILQTSGVEDCSPLCYKSASLDMCIPKSGLGRIYDYDLNSE